MVWLALGVLVCWPAIVLALFEVQPVRKAIVFTFVAGWLFLPPVSIPLPGIPDWSKVTATVISVLAVLMLKRPDRLLEFRPRWFDLPMLGFCACSLTSAVTAGTGVYEGLSSVLEDSLWWGFPYLIGRVYMGDRAGARQLAEGIAVGGLLYVPPCLLEIRLSPILKSWVYGVSAMSSSDYGLRYGGYRPAVFLAMGLEVGWWMCCASLCAFLLVASRATRRWFKLPAVPLAWILLGVTVACKSTGALAQLALGAVLIVASRLGKNALPLWLLLAIAPAYCLARPSGYCSATQITSALGQFFPAERIQSVEFRLGMEDYLISRGMMHPIMGWSRMGNYNPLDDEGRGTAVVDGFWIRVFCTKGAIGLFFLNIMGLLPTLLFLRQNPVRTWITPEVAPMLALATILPLYMVDNLSNAMLNPIYPVAMGVLAGCGAGRRVLEQPREDVEAGDDLEDAQLVEAIRHQARLVRARPYGRNVGHLASLHARHARSLSARGRGDLAVAERSAAEELWRSVGPPPGSTEPWDPERAANANDLAWLMAGAPDADPDRLGQARGLVESALAYEPTRAPFWNTLGIVCYRQGDYHRAIHALSRSVTLGPTGGTAFDFYFLALANRALGYEASAATWLDRAESWHHAHPEMDPALAAIRAELVGDIA